MGILTYQIGIFIAIQIASMFGKSSRNTAIFLISIFTVLQVYTESLMILQFVTITISYFVSKSIFFLKKEERKSNSKKSNYKPTPNLKEKYFNNSSQKKQEPKVNTKKGKSYSEMRGQFMAEMSEKVSGEKKDFKEHLEHNFKEFKTEIKGASKLDKLLAFQNAINKFEGTTAEFEKKTQVLNASLNFENYIFLHKMVSNKLIIAKHEFETKNQILELENFMEHICNEYNNMKGTYKLRKTEHRVQ